jgi:predicted lipoprotein with Yx(FWY)xxD motif
MPPGFQVINTELEGPVFADAAGHTLYTWPSQTQRNSNVGEVAGKPECYDIHYRVTAGITIPYPAGLELPNADHRPTCVQDWPPVLAASEAKPVGNFTILDRTDGTKQWAYKEFALYTSHLDHEPGETYGGSRRPLGKDSVSSGAKRIPAKPAPAVPPKFAVDTKFLGRILVTDTGYSVYSFDRDTPTKSNCTGSCVVDWDPMLAPDTAVARGEWTILVRPGGNKQWAFRGKPLYRYLKDSKEQAYDGSDVPGWHNVFMQRTPHPPQGFQVVDTDGGQVLADAQGRTIYFYSCSEDTPDTLFCDAPDSAQEYRWAVCGAGDPARCLQTFPYVIADKGAKSDSIAWSIRDIDPKTGRYVAAGTPGSLHIWAFRGRPIYTFARDHAPGDIRADVWGTAFGHQNGFSAFWVRDIFYGNYSQD